MTARRRVVNFVDRDDLERYCPRCGVTASYGTRRADPETGRVVCIERVCVECNRVISRDTGDGLRRVEE